MKKLMDQFLFPKQFGQKVRVSSLTVARYFGKLHYNVVRDIQQLDSSAKFNQLNFEAVKYKDVKGEFRPAYTMTRDGFMFLVMGYTGQEAARIKEQFIEKFNQLEARCFDLERKYLDRLYRQEDSLNRARAQQNEDYSIAKELAKELGGYRNLQ